MRFQPFLSITIALSSYLGYVGADFHYGTADCAEAQGGSIHAGFILSEHHDTCLDAFNADKPGENIPHDTKKPTGIVCAHNVTIDLGTHKWHSKSKAGAPMSGSCRKLGKGGKGITSKCAPPFARCVWKDFVVCSSHICK